MERYINKSELQFILNILKLGKNTTTNNKKKMFFIFSEYISNNIFFVSIVTYSNALLNIQYLGKYKKGDP